MPQDDNMEFLDMNESEFKSKKGKGDYKRKGKGKGNSMTSTSYNTGSRYVSTPIKLSSNVPDITFVNPAEAYSSLYTPLYVAQGDFFTLVEDAETKTTLYDKIVKDIIYWNYYDEIVRKANGNDYIDTNMFSVTSFVKWINAISNALQLYYNVESVLAFNSTPENENIGLITLQNNLNSGVRRKHRDLRDILTRMSIPRNMENIINYLYQNFSYCEDPQSPIVRLNWRGVFYPEDLVTATTTSLNYKLSEDLFDTVIDALNNPVVREIDSMIGITAKYSKDKSRFLSATSSKAVNDKNFLTWWHNMPVICNGLRSPYVTTSDTSFYYGKSTFPMDGIIYALGGAYIGTGSTAPIFPALYSPWDGWDGTKSTNKKRYGNVLYYTGDVTAGNYPLASVSAFERFAMASKVFAIGIASDYAIDNPTYTPGFNVQIEYQKIQTHTLNNMRSSVESAVRWLFS